MKLETIKRTTENAERVDYSDGSQVYHVLDGSLDLQEVVEVIAELQFLIQLPKPSFN